MALKLTVSDLSEVPESAQALYIPTEDGSGYRLDVEQPAPTEQRLGEAIAMDVMTKALDANGANGFLIAPHLKGRVKAVANPSGVVDVQYFDEKGNAQTEAAFVDSVKRNPKFAGLVVGTKANGGGASGLNTNHGSGYQHQQAEAERLDITGGRLTRARGILANNQH
ncbi:hypothetical protein RBD90_004483 [Salmonella enterica]|nr:hypothetical protein [Salmonella enterica]ELG7717156.1 hypothetical protein [Salmonella enterica]ELH0823309.1 hypothetical protein [Salmonella enterica]